MKIGLHISNFTWPDGTPRWGPALASVLHGGVRDPWDTKRFDMFTDEVVPALEAL